MSTVGFFPCTSLKMLGASACLAAYPSMLHGAGFGGLAVPDAAADAIMQASTNARDMLIVER